MKKLADGVSNVGSLADYREPDQGAVSVLLGELRAVEGEIEARMLALADSDTVIKRGQGRLREDRYGADPEVRSLESRRQDVLGRLGGFREPGSGGAGSDCALDAPLPRDLWVRHGSKLLNLIEDAEGMLELFEIQARDARWIPDGVSEHPYTTVLRVNHARWLTTGAPGVVQIVGMIGGGLYGFYAASNYLFNGLTANWIVAVFLALTALSLLLFRQVWEYLREMWGRDEIVHPYVRFPPGIGSAASKAALP